jgi:hypothetical protein
MPALTITNLGSLAARIDTSAMAAVDLEVVSTAGTGGTKPRSGRLYYASSFRTLTASGGFYTNQQELSRVSSFFEFGFRGEDTGVRSFSQRVKCTGDYLYVWLEFDGATYANPATVVAVNYRGAESGGVGGDASAANQLTEITATNRAGTREYNIDAKARSAVTAAAVLVPLPTLAASRELYVMGSSRMYYRTGTSGMSATSVANGHPLAADERFHFRVPAGHTHMSIIRDSADGFIDIVPTAV